MLERIRSAIRDVPDFPKPGVVFKDITPVLADAKLFRESICALAAPLKESGVSKVVGVDARGFIFASALAMELGLGFIPVRKKGKLPWKTRALAYSLEYGEEVVEVHKDAILPGEKVVLVDDVLATGGTAAAAAGLILASAGEIMCACFFIELGFLKGRSKLEGIPIHSLVVF